MSAKMMPRRKPRFSEAIKTKDYQSLIYNTLGDPNRSRRFIASITSAVAVNAQLQECDAGSILAGSLLGESLGPAAFAAVGPVLTWCRLTARSRGRDARSFNQVDDKGNWIKDSRGRLVPLTEKKAQFVLGIMAYTACTSHRPVS